MQLAANGLQFTASADGDKQDTLQSTWRDGRKDDSPFFISVRFHWPMQGPQALASTVPPTFSKISIKPSRSIVARICSLPGVMVNGTCCTAKVQIRAKIVLSLFSSHSLLMLSLSCAQIQDQRQYMTCSLLLKQHLGLDAGLQRLLGDAGGARHVLVGAVGAAADEAGRQLARPPVLLDGICQLRACNTSMSRIRGGRCLPRYISCTAHASALLSASACK